VKERPAAKVSPASASLVLDTYVTDEQWIPARDTADQFLAIEKLGDATFKENLGKLSDAASFKLIEIPYQAKDYKKTIEMATAYLANSKIKGHAADALYLASHSANRLGDTEHAGQFLSQLLTQIPGSEHKGFALRARADLSERQYDFDGARQDYAAYLGLPGNSEKSDGIKRAWFANWLSKKPNPVSCREYGDSPLLVDCEKYQALVGLALNQSPLSDSEVVKKATKGAEANRAIWAAVGLKLGKSNFLHQQWSMAGILASEWKNLDPLIQFSLIPVLNQVLPDIYVKARRAIPGLAKLNPSSAALTKRIDLIRQIEASAAKAAEAPWTIVRTVAINSISQIYLDFCAELSKVAPPADISAEDLATYQKTVAEIIEPFAARGESLGKQGREIASTIPQGEREKYELALLDKYSEDGTEWSTLTPNPKAKPAGNLAALWAEAFRAHSWPRMGYFYLELKERSKLSDTTLTLMKAITLGMAGAETEAHIDYLSIQSKLEEIRAARQKKEVKE
jgi:hypothetical protein